MDFYRRISSDHFTAYRLLDYRSNAFNPILHGRFIHTSDGTDIVVRMYPSIINILLVGLMLGVILVYSVVSFLGWLINGQTITPALTLFVVFIMLYSFILNAFAPEAKRAEEFLLGLFKDKNERGNLSF